MYLQTAKPKIWRSSFAAPKSSPKGISPDHAYQRTDAPSRVSGGMFSEMDIGVNSNRVRTQKGVRSHFLTTAGSTPRAAARPALIHCDHMKPRAYAAGPPSIAAPRFRPGGAHLRHGPDLHHAVTR